MAVADGNYWRCGFKVLSTTVTTGVTPGATLMTSPVSYPWWRLPSWQESADVLLVCPQVKKPALFYPPTPDKTLHRYSDKVLQTKKNDSVFVQQQYNNNYMYCDR